MKPTNNIFNRVTADCKRRHWRGWRPAFEKLKVIHLDLILLDVAQFYVANLTQIANMPPIAFADGY